MQRTATTNLAFGAFLAMLLVMAVLVATTSVRVEHLGPVIVFGGSFVAVLVLLFAPARKDR